jgi:hypothetical protein
MPLCQLDSEALSRPDEKSYFAEKTNGLILD